MVRALAAHVALREAIEFSVNQRREFLEGRFLAVAPCFQQLSKFVSPIHRAQEFITLQGFSRRFSRMNAGLI